MKILLLITALFLVSCRAIKPIIYENKTIDSIYIKEVIRDTTIKVEADSSMIRALVECDSLGNAHLKELIDLKHGQNINAPSLNLKNNILTSSAKVDSMAIYLELKDIHKIETKIKESVKIVEVNILTWWQKLWIKLGKWLSGVVVIIAGVWVLKRRV